MKQTITVALLVVAGVALGVLGYIQFAPDTEMTTDKVLALEVALSNGEKTTVGQILNFNLTTLVTVCQKQPTLCTR